MAGAAWSATRPSSGCAGTSDPPPTIYRIRSRCFRSAGWSGAGLPAGRDSRSASWSLLPVHPKWWDELRDPVPPDPYRLFCGVDLGVVGAAEHHQVVEPGRATLVIVRIDPGRGAR